MPFTKFLWTLGRSLSKKNYVKTYGMYTNPKTRSLCVRLFTSVFLKRHDSQNWFLLFFFSANNSKYSNNTNLDNCSIYANTSTSSKITKSKKVKWLFVPCCDTGCFKKWWATLIEGLIPQAETRRKLRWNMGNFGTTGTQMWPGIVTNDVKRVCLANHDRSSTQEL